MKKQFYSTTGKKLTIEGLDAAFANRLNLKLDESNFFQHETTLKTLKKLLNSKKNILLTGEALSGKTKLLHTALNDNSQALYIAYFDFADLELSQVVTWEDDSILVLDELPSILLYAEQKNGLSHLRNLLEAINAKGINFVATCQSGFNFDSLVIKINQQLWDKLNFSILKIRPLNSSDKSDFTKQWSKINSTPINSKNLAMAKYVGHYFRKLGEMVEDFSNLNKNLNKWQAANNQALVQAAFVKNLMYAVYYTGFFKNSGISEIPFDKSLVLEIEKKLSSENVKTPINKIEYTPFKDFFTKDSDKSTSENSEDAWGFLSSKYSLIKVNSNKDGEIFVEWNLIKKIIEISETQEKFKLGYIFSSLKNIFDTDFFLKQDKVLIRNGFNRDLDGALALNLDSAKSWLEIAQYISIEPDTLSYFLILKKLGSVKEKLDFIKDISPSSEEIDFYILYNLILKSIRNLDELKIILSLAQKKNIYLNLNNLFYIFDGIKNIKQEKELLELFKNQKAVFNSEQWYKFIRNSNNYSIFKEKFELAKNEGHSFEQDVLEKIILSLPRWSDIEACFKLICKKIETDKIKFLPTKINQLIQNTPILEEANFVVEIAQKNNIKISPTSAAHLIKIGAAEDNILNVKELLSQQKTRPTSDIFSELILKSKNVSTALSYLDELEKLNIRPNMFLYEALFKKLPSVMIFKYYMQMLDYGITPSYFLLFNLVKHSKKFKHALHWLYEMLAWGFTPNKRILDIAQTIAEKNKDETSKKSFQTFLNDLPEAESSAKLPIKEASVDDSKIKLIEKTNAVFISYSHQSVRERDLLIANFKQAGINCYFDSKFPTYKDTVPKFSKRLYESGDKLLICVVDSNYLESPFCLFELCTGRRFVEQAWPIFLDMDGLDTSKINTTVDFWRKEQVELKKLAAKNRDLIQKQKEPIKNDPTENFLHRKLLLINQFLPKLNQSLTRLSRAPYCVIDDKDSLQRLIAKIKNFKHNYRQNSNSKTNNFKKYTAHSKNIEA